MKMTLLPALVAALFAMGAQADGRSAARYFDLAFVIARDGKVLATPKATVAVGEPARMMVDKPDGTASFRLDFAAEPVVTEKGVASAWVTATLHERKHGEWVLVAEPSVQVPLDNQPGTVTVRADAGDSSKPAAYAFSVSAKVAPAPASKKVAGS